MATRKRTATVTETPIEQVVETPVEEVVESPVETPAPKAPPLKVCACGCGTPTKGTWAPGHDARHHSALNRRFDQGDAGAGTELIERGWATAESLATRGQKADSSDQAKAARLLAKADRLSEQMDELNHRRDALLAERKALLGTPAEPDQAEPAGPVEEVTS